MVTVENETEDGTRASRRRSHHEVRPIPDEDKHSGSSHGRANHDVEGEKPHHWKYGTDDNGKDSGTHTSSSAFRRYMGGLWSSMSQNLQWVPQNNTWSKAQPVIRCALAAWICGLLFIIPKTENAMGQVACVYLTSGSTRNLLRGFIGQLFDSHRLARKPTMLILCTETILFKHHSFRHPMILSWLFWSVNC